MEERFTWLITGGAGFIGSNFIEYIYEKYPNDFIICFDNLTYAGDIKNFEKFNGSPRFLFIKGDIANPDDIEILFKRHSIDYIVNFAAESHVDRSIENSIPFIRTNIEGVSVLLEITRKHHVKRFHQVSTDEVYGPSEIALDEHSPLNPTSAYAVSKASADLLCLSFFKTFNTPVTISRSTNNYGIKQNAEKFIPKTVKKLKNGEKPAVYGDGKNKRDWIHVLDHCSAIDLIVHEGKNGEIYNVSSDYIIENNELVFKIFNALNISNKEIDYIHDRLAHDFCYSISSNKIKNELGWKQAHNFENNFPEVINWYWNKI